jgi:hypothetical protein
MTIDCSTVQHRTRVATDLRVRVDQRGIARSLCHHIHTHNVCGQSNASPTGCSSVGSPGYMNGTDEGLTIAQAIRDGTAIGISDESFNDGWLWHGLVGVGRSLPVSPSRRGYYCPIRHHGGSRFLSQERTLWLVWYHTGGTCHLRVLQD